MKINPLANDAALAAAAAVPAGAPSAASKADRHAAAGAAGAAGSAGAPASVAHGAGTVTMSAAARSLGQPRAVEKLADIAEMLSGKHMENSP